MTNEQSKIEGIPEGWELVRIGKCNPGEAKLSKAGEVLLLSCGSVDLNCVVVRKIEKPKQYRPFANAEEFKPHRNRWVRIVVQSCGSLDRVCVGEIQAITGFNESSICMWAGWLTYHEGLEGLQFDDGTPFGVEVTEV